MEDMINNEVDKDGKGGKESIAQKQQFLNVEIYFEANKIVCNWSPDGMVDLADLFRESIPKKVFKRIRTGKLNPSKWSY